jgi:polyisoprenoid-binding protein YceI
MLWFRRPYGKSKIRWTGRNLGNLHYGYLGLKEGAVEVHNGVVTGGHFTIDMQSIVCEDIADKTMNKLLVAHLSSADFFETNTFPEGKFTLTEAMLIKNASPGVPNYRITGDLTLKGITRPVDFEAVIGWNTEGKLFAQAAFEIDRTKWKVMYGSGRFFERLGMHLVNDNITLQLFITAD